MEVSTLSIRHSDYVLPGRNVTMFHIDSTSIVYHKKWPIVIRLSTQAV